MARGKKTGGKDFPKGISQNPHGRPPIPQEIRDFRAASKEELTREFKYIYSLRESDLQSLLDDDETPIVRKTIAKVWLTILKTGDAYAFDKVLERIIGKVKEEIDLTNKVSFHKRLVDKLNELEGGEPKDDN